MAHIPHIIQLLLNTSKLATGKSNKISKLKHWDDPKSTHCMLNSKQWLDGWLTGHNCCCSGMSSFFVRLPNMQKRLKNTNCELCMYQKKIKQTQTVFGKFFDLMDWLGQHICIRFRLAEIWASWYGNFLAKANFFFLSLKSICGN